MNNIGNISVVIPTYNRRQTIGRSIDSILNQTLFPSEIIVVDDGSTDGTSDYIQSNFPSIRLLQQPNKGVSSARNMGIRSSNSDWVALLDSDDEWFPKKLEKQVMTLSQNLDIKFCHTEEIWIRNGVRVNQMKKHQKYGGHIFNKCLDMCRISPSSVLFHQSILDDVGINLGLFGYHFGAPRHHFEITSPAAASRECGFEYILHHPQSLFH